MNEQVRPPISIDVNRFSWDETFLQIEVATRQKKGQIAENIGMSLTQMARLRNGDSASMEEKTVLRMATEYGLPPSLMIFLNAVQRLPKDQREMLNNNPDLFTPGKQSLWDWAAPSSSNAAISLGMISPRLAQNYRSLTPEKRAGVLTANSKTLIYDTKLRWGVNPNCIYVESDSELIYKVFGARVTSVLEVDVSMTAPDSPCLVIAKTEDLAVPGIFSCRIARVGRMNLKNYILTPSDPHLQLSHIIQPSQTVEPTSFILGTIRRVCCVDLSSRAYLSQFDPTSTA